MRKVFGVEPKIVSSEGDVGPVTIVAGDELSGAPADHAATSGSFSITTGSAIWNGGRAVKVIRLSGADVRGTIYPIYQFSQQYLGIDPMYCWTDNQPAHRTSIQLSANPQPICLTGIPLPGFLHQR
jgi:hypothetical protein